MGGLRSKATFIWLLVWFTCALPLFAQTDRGTHPSQETRTPPKGNTRGHRYVFDGGPAFVLGLNSSYFEDRAQPYRVALSPYLVNGSSLSYGFVLSLNLGIIWLLDHKPPRKQGLPQHMLASQWRQKKTWAQAWGLGLQLRSTLGLVRMDFSYRKPYEHTMAAYHQNEQRSFTKFQAVISLRYYFLRAWELQFYLGPSLNVTLYRADKQSIYLPPTKKPSQTQVVYMPAVGLGAVAGAAFAYRLSTTLALGFGVHLMLPIIKSAPHNIINFGFGLYVQADW